MSSYIHFTDDQKALARQTDIVSLLISQGETVKRSGIKKQKRSVTVFAND